MVLSAVSFLVVAQSSSEIPDGLMNNPVLILQLKVQNTAHFSVSNRQMDNTEIRH